MAKPICQIYYSKTENVFMIESLAVEEKYGWTASYGSLLRLSAAEMRQKGLDLIVQDLAQFQGRLKTGRSELEELSESERIEFTQRWTMITACLENPHALKMTPMHMCEGGYVGLAHEEMRVALPSTNERFWGLLLEACGKCG